MNNSRTLKTTAAAFPVCSERIKKALKYMENAHRGQLRKGTDLPYTTHTRTAGEIACSMTDDEDVIIAALLHDTIEDAGKTEKKLTAKFGKRVAGIVAAESEKKEDSEGLRDWAARKEETISEITSCDKEDVLIVCLADKLANMRAIKEDYLACGEELWKRFNMQDPAKQGWYYSSLCRALGEKLGEYNAWKELDTLVTDVFSKYL